MKKVAKLIIIDPDDKYLLMHRSDHPTFGGDPDLPGGTLEDDETLLETMLREVKEESGVSINAKSTKRFIQEQIIRCTVHITHCLLQS